MNAEKKMIVGSTRNAKKWSCEALRRTEELGARVDAAQQADEHLVDQPRNTA